MKFICDFYSGREVHRGCHHRCWIPLTTHLQSQQHTRIYADMSSPRPVSVLSRLGSIKHSKIRLTQKHFSFFVFNYIASPSREFFFRFMWKLEAIKQEFFFCFPYLLSVSLRSCVVCLFIPGENEIKLVEHNKFICFYYIFFLFARRVNESTAIKMFRTQHLFIESLHFHLHTCVYTSTRRWSWGMATCFHRHSTQGSNWRWKRRRRNERNFPIFIVVWVLLNRALC